MDLGIKGKVALVTGGSSGIGFGIAQCLAEEGCQVIISSRDEQHIHAAIERLKERNSEAVVDGKAMDLLDEKQIRKTLSEISKIDILVNNVGGPAAGNSLEISLQDWDRGYASLLRSVILLCQLVVPKMKERKWGRILTITSTSAKELIANLPVSGTFRAGLTSWTKSLAKEVGEWGILANNLLPGLTNTARLSELMHRDPEYFERKKSQLAVRRIAEPEEIGKIAIFLCSSANTYITGTDILADGGYTSAL